MLIVSIFDALKSFSGLRRDSSEYSTNVSPREHESIKTNGSSASNKNSLPADDLSTSTKKIDYNIEGDEWQ